MKLAVLHVITSLELGGAEAMLLKLSKRMQTDPKQKISIAVLALKKSKDGLTSQFQAAGIQVITLNITSPRFFLNLFRLPWQLNFEPNLIQGWLPHGNMMSLLLQKTFFRRARLFWNIRQSLHTWGTGSSLTRFLIQGGALLSSLPDKIIFNSQTGAQQHFAIGYQSKTSVVIPNGFELDKLTSAKNQRQAYRQKLNIADTSLVLIHVARFDPTKDHETFFKAAIALLANNDSLQIVCVGKNVTFDNPDISKQIPLELRSHFHLLDERRDVAELLSTADIYCSSSRAEAFSNSIGEAMGAGLVCVVTDVGDSRAILQNDEFVVPPGDEKQLHQALFKACLLSPEQRKSLGQKSYERIRDCFSIEAVCNSYVSQWSRPE